MLSNFHTAAAVTKTQKPLFLVDGNVQRQAEHGRDPFRCKSLPESQNQKKVEKSPVNGNGQFLTSTGKLWMYMRVCVYIYTHIHISRIHTRWMIHAYLRWWPEDELNSYFPARNIYIYTHGIYNIYIYYIYKYICVCVWFFSWKYTCGPGNYVGPFFQPTVFSVISQNPNSTKRGDQTGTPCATGGEMLPGQRYSFEMFGYLQLGKTPSLLDWVCLTRAARRFLRW